MTDKLLAAKIREIGEYIVKHADELARDDTDIFQIRASFKKTEESSFKSSLVLKYGDEIFY